MHSAYNNYDKYNKKILDYKDTNIFIIFYSPHCRFCINAMKLLKDNNLSFKSYNINHIKNGLQRLLHYLNTHKIITQFNEKHKTIPIIFYNGKFIGGFSDLALYLDKSRAHQD